MQLNKLPLYRPIRNIIIPPAGYDHQNICIIFYPENTDFLSTYNHINITPNNALRRVNVPYINKLGQVPLSYRDDIKEHKLIPVVRTIGDYDKFIGKNFYFDLSLFFNRIIKKYKMKSFITGNGSVHLHRIIESFEGIPSNSFMKVLLYSINLDKPVLENIKKRRIFPLFNMLYTEKGIPLDKVIMHVYDYSGSFFVSLYDKSQRVPYDLNRFKRFILAPRNQDMDISKEEHNKEDIVDSALDDELVSTLPEEAKEKIKTSVKYFVTASPELVNKDSDNLNKKELVLSSVSYSVLGDMDHAKTVTKNIDSNKLAKEIITSYSLNIAKEDKTGSSSRNDIVTMSNPYLLVNKKSPSRIVNLRKFDFRENLRNDLINMFIPLKDERIPIKIKGITVKTISTPIYELNKTLIDKYTIDLLDDKNKKFSVNIELPHLTDDNTFLINGQNRVLVNQLVTYPIFYHKPFTGKFESVYASLTVISKKLKNASYFLVYIGGYKVPLASILGYKLGFIETMKQYNLSYTMTEDKPKDIGENDIVISVGTGYIKITYKDEVGKEMALSLKACSKYFPKEGHIVDENFWRDTLVAMIGNRDCIYQINQVWSHIVTPIERKVLETKGDPSNIADIINKICESVVVGKVDDRNGMDKIRLRSSEIFSHIIQKQVYAAYNEYLSKKFGGDESATFRLDSTKAWSDVLLSQNVQLMENINPLEELSFITRTTPVGIGGVPTMEAFPMKAMNIHPTYYGTIDPLETPDGPDIGIQQHLAIGASIINNRGMFAIRDRSAIKPSEILSVGPAMIPFVESNDGARVIMGTGQTKQAVPLLNPEIPSVQSGYESILTPLLSSNFIKKSPVEGVVSEINPNDMVITDSAGKKYPVDLKSVRLKSGQGKDGLSIFKSVVKIGDKISKDQIVAEGSCIKEGLISNGVNMLVAYTVWDGYTYEDAIVISESAAKKLTSIHHIEEFIKLEPDDDVISIADIGQVYKKGDKLLSYSKVTFDVESFKHHWTDGGRLVNIEIYANTEKIPERLLPSFEKFKKYYENLYGIYPQGKFKEKNELIEGILVKFVLNQEMGLELGDKLNNRHGGKGVIGMIEKDEKMPLTPWGERVEVILDPVTIINRMNFGQLFEIYIGFISRRLSERMAKLNRKEFVSLLQDTIQFLDGTEAKDYSRGLISSIKSISDTRYEKLKEKVVQDRFFPIIIPPFKSPSRENIMNAMMRLDIKPAYSLHFPESNIDTRPVSVGYQYTQKLEHLSSKKLASRGTEGYVGTTMAPTQGKKRGGGQRVGELDLYNLLGWDCPDIIDEFYGPLSSDHATKDIMVHDIIRQGYTDKKDAVTNPVRDIFSQYMTALHLYSI